MTSSKPHVTAAYSPLKAITMWQSSTSWPASSVPATAAITPSTWSTTITHIFPQRRSPPGAGKLRLGCAHRSQQYRLIEDCRKCFPCLSPGVLRRTFIDNDSVHHQGGSHEAGIT